MTKSLIEKALELHSRAYLFASDFEFARACECLQKEFSTAKQLQQERSPIFEILTQMAILIASEKFFTGKELAKRYDRFANLGVALINKNGPDKVEAESTRRKKIC